MAVKSRNLGIILSIVFTNTICTYAFPRPIEVFGSVQSNLRRTPNPSPYRQARNSIPTVGATMYQPQEMVQHHFNSPGARYVDDRYDYNDHSDFVNRRHAAPARQGLGYNPSEGYSDDGYNSMNNMYSPDYYQYDSESPLTVVPRGVNANYVMSPLKTKVLEGFDDEDEALINSEQMNMASDNLPEGDVDSGFLSNAIPKQNKMSGFGSPMVADSQWVNSYAQTPLAQPYDLPAYNDFDVYDQQPPTATNRNYNPSPIARKTFGLGRNQMTPNYQQQSYQSPNYQQQYAYGQDMMMQNDEVPMIMMPKSPNMMKQSPPKMMQQAPKMKPMNMMQQPTMMRQMPRNRPMMAPPVPQMQRMMNSYPRENNMGSAKITSINFGDADSFENHLGQGQDDELMEGDLEIEMAQNGDEDSYEEMMNQHIIPQNDERIINDNKPSLMHMSPDMINDEKLMMADLMNRNDEKALRMSAMMNRRDEDMMHLSEMAKQDMPTSSSLKINDAEIGQIDSTTMPEHSMSSSTDSSSVSADDYD